MPFIRSAPKVWLPSGSAAIVIFAPSATSPASSMPLTWMRPPTGGSTVTEWVTGLAVKRAETTVSFVTVKVQGLAVTCAPSTRKWENS